MVNSNLPLRIGVGVIVLNKNNLVFVGKRKDNPINKWQMPQGGVNKNEDLVVAMKRELNEETSIKNIKILKELDEWFEYELPQNLLGIIWKGKYRGQKQKWYLMRFLGEDNEINIKTKNPEFLDWKWIDLKKITEVVVDFKFHVYKELKQKVENILIKPF